MDAASVLDHLHNIGLSAFATLGRLVVVPADKITDETRMLIRSYRDELLALLMEPFKVDAPKPPRTEVTIIDFALSTGRKIEFKATVPVDQLPAMKRAAIQFRLSDIYGDPPNAGGGYVIGTDGDSLQSLEADLRNKYGSRLESMEVKS